MSTMFIRNILKRFQPLRSGRFICHSCELCSPTYNQCNSTAYYSRSHETSENLESPPTSGSTVSWDTIRRQDKSDFLSKKRGVLDLDEVIQFLNEEGSLDIVVIEVPKKMCYVDHFIICTATSARHVASIAEMANKLYKSKRRGKQPFTLIEGKRISDDWQCIDMGNMVIHIMLEDTREKYNLEKLWTLGHKYDDLMNEKPSDEEIMKRLSMDGLNLMSMNEDTVKALGNLEDLNPWDNPPEDFFDMSSKSDKNESNVDDTLEDDDAFLV
uniref:uncharacterized protein K12H4.2-like n=1 Tax=Styela clava TaxID=7725 RepID=UPI0019393345|nr:uncharacterized protein K12H4.2-like [Styela clava]